MHLHAMDDIFLTDTQQSVFIIQFSVECMCVYGSGGLGGVGDGIHFYSNQASVFLEGVVKKKSALRSIHT